jgi:hypothetical protein
VIPPRLKAWSPNGQLLGLRLPHRTMRYGRAVCVSNWQARSVHPAAGTRAQASPGPSEQRKRPGPCRWPGQSRWEPLQVMGSLRTGRTMSEPCSTGTSMATAEIVKCGPFKVPKESVGYVRPMWSAWGDRRGPSDCGREGTRQRARRCRHSRQHRATQSHTKRSYGIRVACDQTACQRPSRFSYESVCQKRPLYNRTGNKDLNV